MLLRVAPGVTWTRDRFKPLDLSKSNGKKNKKPH